MAEKNMIRNTKIKKFAYYGDTTQKGNQPHSTTKIRIMKNGKKYVQRLQTYGTASSQRRKSSAKAREPRGNAEQNTYHNIKN
jgi:hypothetical protein